MEPYLPISYLNDFIFCPRSIYFHQLYGRVNQRVYHTPAQTQGKAAHKAIDTQRLNLYGFDTYQGVYHQVFYQRKSLVCDLVEPFRPLVDQRIRNAWKLGQIHKEDFSYINGQYRIFGKKSQPYITLLLKSLLEHKQEIFLYVQSYYRAFMQDKPIEQFPIFTGEERC